MPPDDPMGRKGPNLDDFLRKRPIGQENKKVQCPYGKEVLLKNVKCSLNNDQSVKTN